MFFNHNRIQLEVSNSSKARKYVNILKLSITIINNPRVKEEITRIIRKYFVGSLSGFGIRVNWMIMKTAYKYFEVQLKQYLEENLQL